MNVTVKNSKKGAQLAFLTVKRPKISSRFLPQYEHVDMALTQTQLFLGSTVGRGEDRSGLMSLENC
jgi:hypothetical protein